MSRTNRIAQEACRILATRSTAGASIHTNPDRYFGKCLSQARQDHFDTFVAMLSESPGLTPEDLADSVGRAQEAEDVSPASLLPTVVAVEREPLTAQERMTAQTGLSRARQALQEAQEGR